MQERYDRFQNSDLILALNMVTEYVENLYKIFVSQQSEVQW